jgi:hypothetical protein
MWLSIPWTSPLQYWNDDKGGFNVSAISSPSIEVEIEDCVDTELALLGNLKLLAFDGDKELSWRRYNLLFALRF